MFPVTVFELEEYNRAMKVVVFSKSNLKKTVEKRSADERNRTQRVRQVPLPCPNFCSTELLKC